MNYINLLNNLEFLIKKCTKIHFKSYYIELILFNNEKNCIDLQFNKNDIKNII